MPNPEKTEIKQGMFSTNGANILEPLPPELSPTAAELQKKLRRDGILRTIGQFSSEEILESISPQTFKISVEQIIAIEKETARIWQEKIAAKVKEFGGDIPPLPGDLPKFEGSPNARHVLELRYLKKDDDRKVIQTPEERFWEVAVYVARAERHWGKSEEEIYQTAKTFAAMMIEQRFMPNSPTIMNAGKDNGLQGAACFVLPVEDSIVGIFDAIKKAALIHQSGGGTGFAFSRLRPEGDLVSTTKGEASGPVSFLQIFNQATEEIKQGGTRRGANMAILNVHHPDIEKFIKAKSELAGTGTEEKDMKEGRMTNKLLFDQVAPLLPPKYRENFRKMFLSRQIANFNISVALTDEFMECLERDEEYELINPRTKKVVGKRKAKEIWNLLIDNADKSGDPGIIFIDRINRSPANPIPELGQIEATNPCGEVPLHPNDACNLGSLNLGKYVKRETIMRDDLSWKEKINWEALGNDAVLMQRFLDDMIETNPYPLPEIEEFVMRNRKTGGGVMGFDDMLLYLRVPHASETAVGIAEEVMKSINDKMHEETERLAQERGPAPNWQYSIHKNGKPRRNLTSTVNAPTGSISIITDCESGIEPPFNYARHHMTAGWMVRKSFLEMAKMYGFYTDDLADKVAKSKRIQDVEGIPNEWKRILATTMEVPVDWHVRIQAAFQRHTDEAVSKTINMPKDNTRDDVEQTYWQAYKEGLLGITMFKDESKYFQVITSGGKDGQTQTNGWAVREKLPDERDSKTHKFKVGDQEGYVTVGLFEDGRAGEIFVKMSKEGSLVSGLMDAWAVATSLNLQHGVSLRDIVGKLKNMRFEPAGLTGNPEIKIATSLMDYLGRWLELKFIPLEQKGIGTNGKAGQMTDEKLAQALIAGEETGLACPDCGLLLIHHGGCLTCTGGCGFTRCG